jgi:hypothetical protein
MLMPSAIIPSGIMLSVIMLNVVKLNVVVPLGWIFAKRFIILLKSKLRKWGLNNKLMT